MISCIAIGILQLLPFKYPSQNWFNQIRYLRTPSKQNLSEATMADCIRKVIFHTLTKIEHLPITQIIIAKQKKTEDIKLLDGFSIRMIFDFLTIAYYTMEVYT